MISYPTYPEATEQNWILEHQINRYVEEILAMVLPENASKTTSTDKYYEDTQQYTKLKSEESIARQLIKDFTTFQVYSYELQKLYKKVGNSLSFGRETSNYEAIRFLPKYCQEFAYSCLDERFTEALLHKSSPRFINRKKLHFTRFNQSRYANKTLKSNPSAKYHRLRLEFANEFKYDIPRAELSDIENETLIQMKPILLLRDMFAYGFDISKLSKLFGSRDYKSFQDGTEKLKSGFMRYLGAYYDSKEEGFNGYTDKGQVLYEFQTVYYPEMYNAIKAISTLGVRSLDSTRIMSSLHQYNHKKDYNDVLKTYYEIFEGDFQNVPEDPKMQKEWLKDFNYRIAKNIVESTDAEVNESQIKKSLEHYENRMIRRVKMGLFPLSKSFRKKDIADLKYTTISHRNKLVKQIEEGEDKKDPVSIAVVSGITFATSLGVYLSTPMSAPDVPIVTNSILAAITASGISELVKQSILKEKSRDSKKDARLTGLGRIMFEGKYLLYDLLHKSRTIQNESTYKQIINRIAELSASYEKDADAREHIPTPNTISRKRSGDGRHRFHETPEQQKFWEK